MANTLCNNFNGSSNTTTANTTEFWPAGGESNKNATETDNQIIFRSAGTASNLFINITANAIAGAGTFDFRLNAASSALTISIASTSTGIKEDTTHTQAVVAGDKGNYRTVPGATTNTLTPGGAMSIHFDNGSTTVQKCIASNPAGNSTTSASTANFFSLSGNIVGDGGSGEAVVQAKIEVAGTAQTLAINVTVNGRAQASTADLRVAAASSALTKSITGSTTGFFEDNAHTVSLAVGDLVNFRRLTGTSTGTITFTSIACEVTSASGYGLLISDTNGGQGQLTTLTREFAVAGWMSVVSTETTAQLTMRDVFVFSNMNIHINTNGTTSVTSTYKLRKGAADINLTISIATASTGVKEDLVHTDTAAAGDKFNLMFISGNGTVTYSDAVLYSQIAPAAGTTRPAQRAFNLSQYLRMNLGPDIRFGFMNQGGPVI